MATNEVAKLTADQRAAVKLLSVALTIATNSGFLDSGAAWDAMGVPDVINDFCDGITDVENDLRQQFPDEFSGSANVREPAPPRVAQFRAALEAISAGNMNQESMVALANKTLNDN